MSKDTKSPKANPISETEYSSSTLFNPSSVCKKPTEMGFSARRFLQKNSKYIYKLEDRFEKEEYETIAQVTVDQVKEKFGSLRFYYSGGDDTIHGMVWLAEHMSYDICEICGSTKNLGKTIGWIKIICEECASKPNKRGMTPQWKKNHENPKFLRKLKLDILNNQK